MRAVSLLCTAVLGCAAPIVVEATEDSLEECRNDIDEDDNGLVDCEDQHCIDAGLCARFETDCSVIPATGCPRGMFCYANENEQHGSLCSLPGPKGFDEPCEGAGSCRAALHCLGVCRATCLDSSECARDTFCIRISDSEFGTCSVPCIPAFGGQDCRVGECVSTHVFLGAFDGIQALALCADRPAWEGTAGEGDGCDDPPSLQDVSRMCAHGLVCVPLPDASGAVCHSTCALSGEEIRLPCTDASKRCIAAFPLDSRPLLDRQLIIGLCIDP